MVQIDANVAERLVSLVRRRFADWAGFDHPKFVSEETEYKQQAVAGARESLSEAALKALLDAEDYAEIDQRIRASASNLLFLRVPRQGDLNVIMQETLDPPSFCRAFYDLLHGEGPSPARLDRYVEYVTSHDLPNKWTFPTYFLFLCHPETEMFVKPGRAKWFLEQCGAGDTWSGTPNGKTYAAIKDVSAQLLERMRPYGARDMVDIQSLVYVAHAYRKGAPSPDELSDEDDMDETWAAKIEQWLAADMPPERFEARLQGEAKARALLEAKLGEMTESDISEFLSAVSSDLSQGKVTHGRFTPVLVGANARGVASQADAFNEWVPRLWQAGDVDLDAVLDDFWRSDPINGAGTSLPTVILYLRDPQRYGIWLPFMERGLRKVVSLELDGRRTAASYRAYNRALQAFAREHDLAPQAVDTITWRLSVADPAPTSGGLAEPFRTIFADREEAEWALGLMVQTLERLGVERPDDMRFSISLRGSGRRIRLSFAGWQVIEARAQVPGQRFIGLDLLTDRAGQWGQYVRQTFAPVEGKPGVSNYLIPIDKVREDETELLALYWETVDVIADIYANWTKSNYWPSNHPELAKALLDPHDLARVLSHGLVPPPQVELAEPFRTIFANWDDAVWAFDLMAETVKRLGVQSAEDQRYSISLRGNNIRLVYGAWVVLGLYARGSGQRSVGLCLPEAEASPWKAQENYRYSQRADEPKVNFYYPLDYETTREADGPLMDAYWKAVDLIGGFFQHWDRCKVRAVHQEAFGEALFDRDKLEQLLSKGIVPRPSVAGLLDEEAFGLLERLRDNPTKAFYDSEKDAFAEHLEQPFRDLFAELAERMPQPMRDYLETEKGLFGRIPKNDYGRGGAWPHYWGAFYPKGGKRIEGAQLFVLAQADDFRFGFDLGEHSPGGGEQFQRALADSHAQVRQALEELAGYETLSFGEDDESVASLAEWLAMPLATPRVVVHLTPDEVLSVPRAEMLDRILRAFESVFPLVLLASDPNPGPAIRKYLGLDDDEDEPQPLYPMSQMAADTGIAESDLERWKRALERKGQAILYGPPGTGKTFVAQKLAQHLIGGTDGFSELVQFHPAYAYEDFMLGIRPKGGGKEALSYPVVRGRFLDFCDRAAGHDGPCVLILDEINRANLARVFGELMYLLEYRDAQVPLSVDGRPFRIPRNVRLIGTMNTADRSIALVDHALRRRFAFLALRPQYQIIRSWHAGRDTGFDPAGLIRVLERVNAAIADPNYEVGISFFLVEKPGEQLEDVWRMEIEPYLEEYFFDQPAKVAEFRWSKVSESILGNRG